MTVVNFENENQKDFAIRGKIGKPFGLPYWLGWSELGETREVFGRYQVRTTGTRKTVTRIRHHWPADNPTTRQIEVRAIFADGVQAWHSLTSTEKAVYNDARYPLGQSGFTRHMTKYLKENL